MISNVYTFILITPTLCYVGFGNYCRSEACKIFVGGLASEITEKEFGDYFSKFGIVKDAVVMVDRNTGSSRGFG